MSFFLPVYPTKAQRFIEGLVIIQCLLAGSLFKKAKPKPIRMRVILFKPRAPSMRSRE